MGLKNSTNYELKHQTKDKFKNILQNELIYKLDKESILNFLISASELKNISDLQNKLCEDLNLSDDHKTIIIFVFKVLYFENYFQFVSIDNFKENIFKTIFIMLSENENNNFNNEKKEVIDAIFSYSETNEDDFYDYEEDEKNLRMFNVNTKLFKQKTNPNNRNNNYEIKKLMIINNDHVQFNKNKDESRPVDVRYNLGRFCNSIEGLFSTLIKVIFLSIGVLNFEGKDKLLKLANEYISEDVEIDFISQLVETEIIKINQDYDEKAVVRKLTKKLYDLIKICMVIIFKF